ncbi:MAG: hypothetical protein KF862_14355 [Chitinophagaceae bacterium]|nr:hypothetical protein [Chitinophagaceae bacterium]
MKYFVCVLFLFPAIAYSQPNGTSSIKIPGIGLQQVIRGFLDAGYPIERSGQNLKTIISGPKKSSSNNITTVLTVDINDRDIIISGEYSTEEHNYTSIKVTGEKTGPAWDSWKEMFDFADSFKKPVEFIVK